MTERLKKRIEALEEAGSNEFTTFIVMSFDDVDKIDRQILNPKSKVIYAAILDDESTQEQLYEAVRQKTEAIKKGNFAPLFQDYPITMTKQCAK